MTTATTTTKKPYWVTCTGVLTGDASDDSRQEFFKALTRALSASSDVNAPAIHYVGGNVILSAGVRAHSEGVAIDDARIAFDQAVIAAGGTSDLADDDCQDAFRATRLIRWRMGDATVKELADSDAA